MIKALFSVKFVLDVLGIVLGILIGDLLLIALKTRLQRWGWNLI
jgi:hypothetical protein